MASETEGIAALFSMYNDDDDDDDDADEPGPPSPPPPAAAASPSTSPRSGGESPNPNSNPNPSPEHSPPPLPEEQAGRQTLASPQLSPGIPPPPSSRSPPPSSPTPPRPPLAAPPPGLPRPPRRGALAIVDYAHDEMAMSPDQEDGEIMSGIGGLGSDAQDAEGNLEERVLSGTVHLTPNILSETPQHSDAPEQNQVGEDVAMDATGTETEDTRVEEASDISTNVQNDDPLSRFLPPSVPTKCSAALQQKINKFLAYQRAGKSFNAEVRNRKDYRNPDFLQHAVRYQEIDQIGTCFSKDVFNPYGYAKSDYYDEIEADMKRELERKEQEKKRNPKVDFISSGVQPPINPSIAKISAAISAAAAVAGASGPVAIESGQKERSNKKSKWDKVDGDTNPAAPNDILSAAGGSAALLTTGNGYAAFAQQKRKEAGERRTSDSKSDRRS